MTLLVIQIFYRFRRSDTGADHCSLNRLPVERHTPTTWLVSFHWDDATQIPLRIGIPLVEKLSSFR